MPNDRKRPACHCGPFSLSSKAVIARDIANAPGFYQKQGFDIIGEVPAIGDSPGRFFLLKRYL
jgi:hypothetical protein